MKVLKIIEKILFSIAVTIACVAITFSLAIDESSGYPGIVTASSTLLGFSAVTLLILLLVGALLRFSKNCTASRIGDAFTIATFAIFLGLAIQTISYGAVSLSLAASASFVFVASLILRFVAFVVASTKKTDDENTNPDKDPKIQLVLKWKSLLEEKVISQEEYEAKRKEILGLKEPKVK